MLCSPCGHKESDVTEHTRSVQANRLVHSQLHEASAQSYAYAHRAHCGAASKGLTRMGSAASCSGAASSTLSDAGELHLSCSMYVPSFILFCCNSVTKSCPALCSPMDCSAPGFLVLHYLPEFAQTHVLRVGDAIQPSHPLLSPSPPAFNLSQHQDLF